MRSVVGSCTDRRVTEVLTSLFNFFLWNNIGKVDRHLIQEGDIRAVSVNSTVFGSTALMPSTDVALPSTNSCRAFDAQKKSRARAGSLGIQNARDRVDYIIRNELAPIMELDPLTDLERVG